MTTPRLHFGLPSLKGGLAGYAKAFDVLELRCDPALPSAKHLGRLRREAPEGFNFVLVAGRALAELTGTVPPELVEATRRAAETIGARFLLLRTPASAGPSARTRARLARLAQELAGAAAALAWEPRGAWTDEEVVEVASELELTLVRDLAEQEPPPSPVVYTRLLALGRNSRLGSGAIERVAERLEGVEEAFIVIEGEGGAGVAKRLRQAVGEAVPLDDVAPHDDDDDEAFEDEDADEEGAEDDFDDDE
ncbi:MAG TPA: DUF72 domain-containing protein [Polyangiaceae bacterium]|nr:DUF72 domain-containing protein [Polyangiaceae bacterium]